MSKRDLNAYVRLDENGKEYIYQPKQYEYKQNIKNDQYESFKDEVQRTVIFDFLKILPTEQLKVLVNFDVIDPADGRNNKGKRINDDELRDLFLSKSKQIRLNIIV